MMPSNKEVVVLEEAVSVAGRALPAPDPSLALPGTITQVLFYQYVEPMWSKSQRKRILAKMEELCHANGVTGRGRVALEGVNCTLTGTPEGARAFCEGMRAHEPRVFGETDFKLTDGVRGNKAFKALTLKRMEELVAYGLGGEKAPLLTQSGAKHVEAHQYHEMLAKPNTVVIDVRNFYETQIGRIVPPEGGAEFLDPKMRNSHEFPKWLNQPETQEKLQGKQVMMYCTGGIRCERASALVHQMERASEGGLKLEGISMVRGGIDRYMKTFPEGGYWQGKNYLFDLRGEQVPELKPKEKVEKEVLGNCCLCDAPFDVYQGKYVCSRKDCKVPVIVCHKCCGSGAHKGQRLLCPLCKEGYSLREKPVPDLVGQKRKLAAKGGLAGAKKPLKPRGEPSSRLFVGKLPLTVTATDLSQALGSKPRLVVWIRDRASGFFYGSAFVEMNSLDAATRVVEQAEGFNLLLGGRRMRANFSPPAQGQTWPPEDHVDTERPAVPVAPGPVSPHKKKKNKENRGS